MKITITREINKIEPALERREPFVRWQIGLLLLVIYILPLWILYEPSPRISVTIVLAPVLIWLSIIDIEKLIIPDIATAMVALIGLISMAYYGLENMVLEILGAGLFLLIGWVLGEVYFRLRHRDGFGFGDAKLIAACVLCTGTANAWLFLLLASLGGIMGTIFQAFKGDTSYNETIPFGPYISYSAYLVVILIIQS